MPTMDISRSSSRERFVLKALAWSLAIHFLCFGVWKWGQTHDWWQSASMPRWMQALTKKLLTPVVIKLPAPPKAPSAIPLLFVDTDPALAQTKPPEAARFYSANNTLAANPTIQQNSDLPNITGHQQHVPKATDSSKSKAQPPQPSPKPEENNTEQAEAKPKPRQSMTPGDLAMIKPEDRQQPDPGKAQTDNGAAAEPQPAHQRPRTLEEARELHGIEGQKMRQVGGANRIQPDSSFAAMATSYGDYDREFIDAVQTRWDQLLENRPINPSGRVVLEFVLLPTGRITDLRVVENTVDATSAAICSSAISDPAPYRPWPRQMQLDLGTDHRDMRFTFYYENP